MKISLTETNRDFVITVSKPGLKYVDFFLSLSCAGRLVGTGFYPNAKEISESVGVFDQARIHFGLDHRDSGIAFLCIGDGKVPRTGLYAAFMTRWQVLSVDPAMQEKPDLQDTLRGVERLALYPKVIEGLELHFSPLTERVILVFVHSHASLLASLEAVQHSLSKVRPQGGLSRPEVRIDAISLPCCIGDDLGREPSHSLEDDNILSARKTLYFYENLEMETGEACHDRNSSSALRTGTFSSLEKQSLQDTTNDPNTVSGGHVAAPQ